jgi:DNA polymerase-3 subunit alpha
MFTEEVEKYNIPALTNGVRLPDFEIKKSYKEEYNLPDECSDYQFLLALCLQGLSEKTDKEKYKEYYKRMKEELDVFNELGFCSYILITWEIIDYCRKNDIATGFGRGSSGNSLVLYLLDITKIDSHKWGLFFERFLNKTRAKFKEIDGVKYYDGSLLCDIDLDISFSERKKLVEWVEEKYAGRVAKLPTVTTYSTKILIKELCKSLLDYNEEAALNISEMIPVEYGKPKSIRESIKESPPFSDFATKNPKIISIANKLEGLNKNYGVHASAWVITYSDINELFPVRLTRDKELSASYTMDDSLNLAIKIDILGLRCATLIDRVCKIVKIDANKIDINDKNVYKFLQGLKTPKGLFQVEADCNYRVLKQVKPQKIEHLAAIVALARPGVLQFVEQYSKYVETGEAQSVHPFFDDILESTAGIPLFQESLLKMANKVGFTLSESETIRRCIGKKAVKEMAEWEEKVKQKIQENNLDPEISNVLWRILDDSKNYSFNYGHASAYGLMSYATAYLKYYHPKEFFLCLLELSKDEQNTTEEIEKIQQELRFFGIKLLAPDIIKSHMNFSIEGDNLRFGLGYIKGVSEKTLDKIRSFRKEHSNKFEIFIAAKESGLNVGVLSALIQAGCLDTYINSTRSKAVLEAQTWSILTKKEKVRAIEMSKDFKFDLLAIMKNFITPDKNSGKRFIKESREKTIRKKYDRYKKIYDQNSKHEDLACYFYEKKLIGFSYSKKLSDIIRRYYPDVSDLCDIINAIDDEFVDGCGEITDVRYGTSKNAKKTRYVKLTLSDTTGVFPVMMFNDKINNSELVNECKFMKGQIVAFSGNKKNDVVFCNKIINQGAKIVTGLIELKEDFEEE